MSVNSFKNGLSADSKVYSGDRIIQALLEKLGISTEIANNPYVIEKVSIMMCEFMTKSGITIDGIIPMVDRLEGEVKENTIFEILKLLPVDDLNTDEKVEQSGNYQEEDNKLTEEDTNNLDEVEYRIAVSSKRNAFTFVKKINGPGKKQRTITETISETFGYDKTTGNVIESISRRNTFIINTVSKNGIVVKRRWREDNGEMAEMSRTEENPLIASVIHNKETKYYVMTLEELAGMMGKTMGFYRGQLVAAEMLERGEDTLNEAKQRPEYKTTLERIERVGFVEQPRFCNGLEDMCASANIIVVTGR